MAKHAPYVMLQGEFLIRGFGFFAIFLFLNFCILNPTSSMSDLQPDKDFSCSVVCISSLFVFLITKLLGGEKKKNRNSLYSFQAQKNRPAFQNALCCMNRKVWWWHLNSGNKRSLFCVFCYFSCLVHCANCFQFWPFCFLKSLKMQI